MTQEESVDIEALNVTELVTLLEEQGLGIINQALPRIYLVRLVKGEEDPSDQDICPSVRMRKKLSGFVDKHANILRNQLPSCGGYCLEHGCPIGIAINCYDENLKHIK